MKKLILVTLTVLTMSSYLFSTVLSDKIQNATLVVYGSNLGLVHEERDLSLNTADRQIIYEDVAPTLQTDSINV